MLTCSSEVMMVFGYDAQTVSQLAVITASMESGFPVPMTWRRIASFSVAEEKLAAIVTAGTG